MGNYYSTQEAFAPSAAVAGRKTKQVNVQIQSNCMSLTVMDETCVLIDHFNKTVRLLNDS